jgi:peptidoglycan/LPS O-acetylase OafA/YrhL
LLFVRWFKTSGKALVATALVFIVVPLISRITFAVNATDWPTFDESVRSIVICRLDSLFIGVLLAYIRIKYVSGFHYMASWWPATLVIFVGLASYVSLGVPMLDKSIFIRVLYFPLLSISIACLIPWLMRLESTGSALLDRFVTYTSKISYSLYLGHICMLTLLLGIMEKTGLTAHDAGTTALMYVALGVLYFTFGTITYLFIEQPFIKLRNQSLGHSDERSGNVAIAVETKNLPAADMSPREPSYLPHRQPPV